MQPTGGARYIRHSELLESIYTYNDFTHSGGEAVFLCKNYSRRCLRKG